MKKKLIGSLVLGAMLATVPTAAMAEVVTINLGDPLERWMLAIMLCGKWPA